MTALAKNEMEPVMETAVFPPEAFEYTDDVTPEAAAQLRDSAKKEIETDEWELIDGFGQVTSAQMDSKSS